MFEGSGPGSLQARTNTNKCTIKNVLLRIGPAGRGGDETDSPGRKSWLVHSFVTEDPTGEYI